MTIFLFAECLTRRLLFFAFYCYHFHPKLEVCLVLYCIVLIPPGGMLSLIIFMSDVDIIFSIPQDKTEILLKAVLNTSKQTHNIISNPAR